MLKFSWTRRTYVGIEIRRLTRKPDLLVLFSFISAGQSVEFHHETTDWMNLSSKRRRVYSRRTTDLVLL